VIGGSLFPTFRYFVNFGGLFPAIALLTPWAFLSIIERQFFVVFVCTTVVFSYWRLQLRPEDNIFAFYPFMHTLGAVFVLLVTYRTIKAQPRDDHKGLITGAAIVIALAMSMSTIAGFRVLFSSTSCWSRADVSIAAWIRDNTPRNAVFFYEPRALHFVAALTGRQTFFGDPAVLAMEGIDAGSRVAERERWSSDVDPAIDSVVADSGEGPLLRLNRSRVWATVWYGKQKVIFARRGRRDKSRWHMKEVA
jgi:hypothetical protein